MCRDGFTRFFQRLRHDLRFQLLFRVHLLQPRILELQLLQTLHVGQIHAAILGAPFVKARVAHAVLAAQLGHRHAGLRFLKNLKYLTLFEPRLPHS